MASHTGWNEEHIVSVWAKLYKMIDTTTEVTTYPRYVRHCAFYITCKDFINVRLIQWAMAKHHTAVIVATQCKRVKVG